MTTLQKKPGSPRFLSVCLNPVIQKTILLPQLRENQVNRSHEYYHDASGKGVNVTRVLTQLNEQVVHLTQLGGRFRDYFLSMTADDGLDVQWVESYAEIRSCYTLISQANQTSTEIVEEARPVEKGTEARVMHLFQNLLSDVDAMIISGTKAAGFSDNIFPDMVRLAKQAGKVVILDYRGNDLLHSLPFQPDVIKPNFQEFVATFFPEAGAETDAQLVQRVQEKMLELYHQNNIITILTRGSQALLYPVNEAIKTVLPPTITPLNTIGCGDAFAAGFTARWIREGILKTAIQNGITCARKNARLIRPGVIE